MKRFIGRLLYRLRNSRASDANIIFDPSSDQAAVLAESDNASIYYFVRPHLQRCGLSISQLSTVVRRTGEAVVRCRLVVITRYLRPEWVEILRAFRRAGGQIVYFMDDDLMDRKVVSTLPRAYAQKITCYAMRPRAQLEALCDAFWVGTPFLAEKYADWKPTVLVAGPERKDTRQSSAITFCYHGSASHQAELQWLVAVVRRVQERSDNLHFEVIGDLSVNRLFRNLPRVTVIHPMSWANYRDYTRAVTRHIGLAPLLPEPFNAARSPTKFFDFVRMGAVGLYTDVAPYKGFIRDGVDGLLLPNDPDKWADEILRLGAAAERRAYLARAAGTRAELLAWDEEVLADVVSEELLMNEELN